MAPTATSFKLNTSDNLNRTNGTVFGYFDYADTDNDLQSRNETRWFINYTYYSVYNNLTLLNETNTTKGYNFTFSARVFDGSDWSDWTNSTTLTIQNMAPLGVTTFTQPSSPFNTSLNTSIAWTVATDADGDTLRYYFYIDQNNPPITLRTNSTQANSSSLLTAQGLWYYRVASYDGSDFGSNSSIRNIFYDTLNPGAVRFLMNLSNTNSTILINWTNPTDTDFNFTQIYVNNIFEINTTDTNYSDSNLINGTNYTYSLRTYDKNNNINTTWMNLSVLTWNNSDTEPPGSVRNLLNISQDYHYILWNWTNPSNEDFNYSLIQINGEFLANTSDSFFNHTSLTASARYTINITTFDIYGNQNTTRKNLTTITGDIPPLPSSTIEETVPVVESTLGGKSSSFVGAPVVRSWSTLSAGQQVSYSISQHGNPVNTISFTVTDDVKDASIVIQEFKDVTRVPLTLEGSIYFMFSITEKKVKVKDVEYEFTVEKKWLDSKNVHAEDVTLFRFDNNEWIVLPTQIIKQDDQAIFYRSSSPGFSYYAIVAQPQQLEKSPLHVVSQKEINGSSQQAQLSELKPSISLIYTELCILSIVFILILLFVRQNLKK